MKYCLFAATYSSWEAMKNACARDHALELQTHTPLLEIEAPNLWEAIDFLSSHFEDHPVFTDFPNQYYYQKLPDGSFARAVLEEENLPEDIE